MDTILKVEKDNLENLARRQKRRVWIDTEGDVTENECVTKLKGYCFSCK